MKYTFSFDGHLITVRATSLEEGERLARLVLDKRAEKAGVVPIVWHLTLKSRTSASGNQTKRIRAILDDRDQMTGCRRCGQLVSLTFDHIIPKSKGGKWMIENLTVLCEPHNSNKRDRIAYSDIETKEMRWDLT